MSGPGAPYSQLDAQQVLRQAFDESTDSLRVNTEATIVAGAMEVVIDQVDDSIKAYLYDKNGNGITSTLVTGKQSIDINVTQTVLPTGASTSALQTTGNTSLSSIDTKLSSTNTKLDTLHSDNLVIEGKQDTGNTSLGSIDTKLTDKSQFTRLTDGSHDAEITNTGSLKVAINERLTETRDRVFVKETMTGVSLGPDPGTRIHSIGGGMIFYLTGLIITAISNSDVIPQFYIQNDLMPLDTISFIFQPKPIGGVEGILSVTMTLENNPIPFVSDVKVILLTGDVTASITIIGYEELA